MKTIEQMYRSVLRPRPLWTEQALYCGYTYVEICDGVWLPRELEWLVRSVLAGDRYSEEARKRIAESERLFVPNEYQKSDYCKLVTCLNRFKVCSIIGRSPALESVLQKMCRKITIYSDSEYECGGVISLSDKEIARSTSHVVTFVDSKRTDLKEYIVNWGNVIVYTESMWYEPDGLLYLMEGSDVE